SILQLLPTGRLRRRNTAASTGTILIAQRCIVAWSRTTPRSSIISSRWRKLSGVRHIPAHAREHHFQPVVHPLDHRAQRCDHRLHLVVKISGQLSKYALIATEPMFEAANLFIAMAYYLDISF